MSIKASYDARMINLLRVLVFQSLWFLFAYWGNWNYQFLAPLVALIAIHLDWKLTASEINYRKFLIFTLVVLASGIIVDTALSFLGFISFKQVVSPMNMWAIWIIFVPYYSFAFEKFYSRPYLSIILALIGAPMAYSGGAKLSSFVINQYGLYAIAIAWVLFFPLSVKYYYGILLKRPKNSGN
jgi:hypothetical protein